MTGSFATLASLSGLSLRQAAGDPFLALSYDPTHLDPLAVPDLSRSRFCSIRDDGESDGGTGDPRPPDRALEPRWRNGSTESDFDRQIAWRNHSLGSLHVGRADRLLLRLLGRTAESNQVLILLEEWPGGPIFTRLKEMEKPAVLAALAWLSEDESVEKQMRVRAMSALLAVGGMEAAATPALMFDLILLERIAALTPGEWDGFFQDMGLSSFQQARWDPYDRFSEVIPLLPGVLVVRQALKTLESRLLRSQRNGDRELRKASLAALGHVIDTSLNFFRWISSVERERESEVRQAKKRIRLEMRRRAGAGDLTDEGDADEKSPEMRVPVAEALRLWPGKASLERLQNLGASVPEALRGIASDTDGKKEMRGLAASALLFLEGFPAATSLFPSFFDLYVSGVADPLPLRRVEAEAEMFRLGYQLMHNELRGWNRFAHAAMIRVLGEASLQALRILKRRASRSGNEARMIRLMLATVSKEG